MASVECAIVEVVVFRRVKGTPQYLALKRASTEKLYPNLWQIVSGKARKNERMIDAAMREMLEETRLPMRRFWTVPFVSSFYDPVHDVLNFGPLFAAEVESAVDPILSKEHRDFRWLTFDDAIKTLVWPGSHQGLEIVHRYILEDTEAARLTEIKLNKQ